MMRFGLLSMKVKEQDMRKQLQKYLLLNLGNLLMLAGFFLQLFP